MPGANVNWTFIALCVASAGVGGLVYFLYRRRRGNETIHQRNQQGELALASLIDLADRVEAGVVDLGSLFEDDQADHRLLGVLPTLRRLPTPMVLNLGGNTGLTAVGWKKLGEDLLPTWSESLEDLSIMDCDLTPEKLGAVAPGIRGLRKLSSLSFGYNRDLSRDWICAILGVELSQRVNIEAED